METKLGKYTRENVVGLLYVISVLIGSLFCGAVVGLFFPVSWGLAATLMFVLAWWMINTTIYHLME